MKRILALVFAACLLCGGLGHADVEGVTQSVYEEGINLITLRVSESNRASTLATFDRASADGLINFVSAFSSSINSIRALTPQITNVNDQKFIDALLSIQARVNQALTYDVLDTIDNIRTPEAEKADADARWASVRALAESVSRATTVSDLEAITRGEAIGAPTIYAKLERGSKGDAVKALQTRLKELDYLSGNVDGDYGSKTVMAVLIFEQTMALTVDGIADEQMQTVLFSDSALKRGANGDFLYDILAKGSNGANVRTLQLRLKALNYLTGMADGSYGSQTEVAIKQFQSVAGLPITGVADSNTQARLFAEDAPANRVG